MTKTKNRARRLLSLFVSLALTLTLLVPALVFAADGSTSNKITIKPNEHTLTPADDEDEDCIKRFHAYQIFKGTLGAQALQTDQKNPAAGQLADVTWGSGIDSNKIGSLLTELLKSDVKLGTGGLGVETTKPENSTDKFWTEDYTTSGSEGSGFTVTGDTTLGALFAQALTQAGYTVSGTTVEEVAGKATYADSAAVIAKVISVLNANSASQNPNNTTLAYTFAKIVGKMTKDAETSVYAYDFLSTEDGAYKVSTWTPRKWTIDNLDAGYYLVLDVYTSTSPEENVNSDYIIAVYGDQEINIKSNDASVDKEIVTGPTTTAKGDSAGVGDTVKFRLTGTLAENYPNYETYKYVFHDKLSDGLTFGGKDTVKVYAVKPAPSTSASETIYDITIENPNADTYYNVITTSLNDDCTLEVAFANLKTSVNGKEVTDYGVAPTGGTNATTISLTYGWKVVVEYTATVNENATVVNPTTAGTLSTNTNTVYLEYSNDPKSGGEGSTGKTTNKDVYVYVYGENVDKRDGAHDKALAGAGFALTKPSSDASETLYAVLKKLDDKTTTIPEEVTLTTVEYVICDWITEAQVKAIKVNNETIFTSTGEHWKDPITGRALNTAVESTRAPLRFDADADYYLAITTVDTDLDAAHKTKSELKIAGLDADVTYTMIEVSTPNGYDTMDDISFKITATITDAGALTNLQAALTADTERNDVEFTSPNTSGYIPVELRNMPAGYLPGTGGMGTALFYTGGAVMLALGGLHIFRRRRFAN